MENILKSDVFFFISSLSVVIITVILVVAGFYLIKILKNFSEMSDTINEAVEDANAKVRGIKEHIKNVPFLGYIFGKKKKSKDKIKE